MAVDGEGVAALAEGGATLRGGRHEDVADDVAGARCGWNAVEVDLGVFIVVDAEPEVAGGQFIEVELASEPDVRGCPGGADANAGGARRAEHTKAGFPGRIVALGGRSSCPRA